MIAKIEYYGNEMRDLIKETLRRKFNQDIYPKIYPIENNYYLDHRHT